MCYIHSITRTELIMIYTAQCTECDEAIVVEIEGENIKATRYEPAEYVYAAFVARDCNVSDDDDACSLNDDQVRDNAFAQWQKWEA